MRISNRQFGGERPKSDAWNLGDTEAQLAIDCELTSTGIRALRENSVEARFDIVPKTLHYFDGKWLAWDTNVCVAESPVGVATRRVFWTGEGYPKQATAAEKSNGISYRMGVPTPNAPTIKSITGEALEEGTTKITTFYVATFVNQWGEEGDKSVPSNTRTYYQGETLTVGNIGATEANLKLINEYTGITSMRLYRFSEGASRFVVEIPLTTTEYADETDSVIIGDAFDTEDYVPPPDGMQGLHMMANDIALGFVGKTVHVSVPGQPNAWPYSFPVRSNVVGISSFDNTAVILTEGNPEVATIYDPENISPSILAQREPCMSRESIVQAQGGVIYAAASGLFYIGPSGGTMLTENFMDVDNWKLLRPHTIHAAFRDGQYYAWHEANPRDIEGSCMVFDVSEENAVLRQLSAYYSAAHVKQGTDELYLANGNLLELFEGGERRLVYRWMSKEHGIGNPIAMACARVISTDYRDPAFQLTDEEAEAERRAAMDQVAEVLRLRLMLGMEHGVGGAINQDVFAGAGAWEIPGAPSELGEQDIGTSINGGSIKDVPNARDVLHLDVKVYADSELMDLTVVRSEEPYRLSYWDRVRHWEYELEGNIDVQQFDMAGAESELHSGS